MNDIELKRTDEIVWQVSEDKPNLTQVNNYHIYLPEQNTSWLSTIAQLPVLTQITAIVSLLTLGYFSLSFISIAVSGLAVFSLAVLGIVTNFITTIAIGVGILLLVILGVTGIMKL